MKKYVWLLIAAAFAVAVLAMVGCKPAETPTASPSPTAPTPTADTAYPEVVSTVVQRLYTSDDPDDDGSFAIILTFDEPIAGDWACITNPANWTITVVNPTRQGSGFEDGVKASNVNVTQISNQKIKITATITEGAFAGLICSKEDANEYKKDLGLQDYQKPSVADTVKWKLAYKCKIYDQLGNTRCGLEDSGCCAAVCEPVTPPSGCSLW
ncbi:hypothetical protein [Candidatus Caldatribacterium saccharofermentans]|uniref:hypothetical protein n=1 Tax=Candidatus Caldatribacterium saccharofermentans TaxID=1454753 RepID=UPI003CFD1393